MSSSNTFLLQLENLCGEARRHGHSFISDKDVKILATKYLDGESHLLSEDGRHLFSFADVVSGSAMSYIFDSVKRGNGNSLFYGLDADMLSPYHYAATYDLDMVFSHILSSQAMRLRRHPATHLNVDRIRQLCLHIDPETKHSVSSILISKDRKHLLKSCMYETLGIAPYNGEFKDTYITWLHEAIASDAPKTALYLCRSHHHDTKQCLLRGRSAQPSEHMSPLDLLLLGDHHRDKVFFTDVILGGMEGGYKTIATSYDILLSRMHRWAEVTTMDPSSFVLQCVRDNIVYGMN